MNKIKPITEIRYCQYCGKPLERKHFVGGVRDRWEDRAAYAKRKYCDRKCMSKAFEVEPGERKGTSWYAKHNEARAIMGDGSCLLCGSSRNVDVHHIDGNYLNNDVSNLCFLCRSCHNKVHRGSEVIG